MLVVATVAFGEAVRLVLFNFNYQARARRIPLGPHGGLQWIPQIPLFPKHGWSTSR